jgi:hypothetical protein
MTTRSIFALAPFALAPLALFACGTSTPARTDGGASDLAGRDLALGDGGGCLAETPPTQLYEDPCTTGSANFCLIDHTPTDFF